MAWCQLKQRDNFTLHQGTRPRGKPTLKWNNNIKTDLKEIGYEYVDWINLAQDRAL